MKKSRTGIKESTERIKWKLLKPKKIAKVVTKNKDYHILVFGVCACRLKGHHSDTIFYFNLTPDISPIGCLILVNTEQKE